MENREVIFREFKMSSSLETVDNFTLTLQAIAGCRECVPGSNWVLLSREGKIRRPYPTQRMSPKVASQRNEASTRSRAYF